MARVAAPRADEDAARSTGPCHRGCKPRPRRQQADDREEDGLRDREPVSLLMAAVLGLLLTGLESNSLAAGDTSS